MQAVVVHEFGGIDRVSVDERPVPAPGKGEVLVRVGAVAANFVDTIVIAGNYQFKPQLPFTPGKGPAGTVAALGEGVTGLSVGDRVLAMAEIGGYAEYALAPADQCYALPASMSFEEAASTSLAADTAWFGLRERGRVQPGESVLVLGATGAVGIAAVQLAKAFGAKVLAGVSSMAKADLVREAGADAVIDLSRENLRDSLRDQVQAETGGAGADVVLDMLGGDIFDAALRAMAWRGRLVVIGFAAGRIPSVKANYLLVKNIEVSGLQISDYRKRMPDLARRCFEEIFALHGEGKLHAPVFRTYPLSQAQDALAALLDRGVKERIVMTVETNA
ncbi:NADPH:quinone oxidoreductase family protein [Pararoseomonas indoligenes]|uniref:NADPH:quinone oxidoreductase family protein n=1 Tax=Roseomonas indoligenes TaxID=2820811 RepID=A0A940N5Y6_9PROT|nr:NADPH:quinone oxidoreductase family protein [Pararoseomonas indoligenes]MBP0495725.1 NADPH:quinone oxidoreductase family protein [Pararoseomonas indoligenes]